MWTSWLKQKGALIANPQQFIAATKTQADVGPYRKKRNFTMNK